MSRLMKVFIGIGAFLLAVLVIAIVSFNSYLKFVDSYEVGYMFDATTGKVEILQRTGWFKKLPYVQKINTVDLRPMQVCINANSRVLNCKLVQFNPAGLSTFIAWHGRNDYSTSTSEVTGGFNDIMKSYAYDGSGRNYPFLTILRELRADEVGQPLPSKTPVIQTPVTK